MTGGEYVSDLIASLGSLDTTVGEVNRWPAGTFLSPLVDVAARMD